MQYTKTRSLKTKKEKTMMPPNRVPSYHIQSQPDSCQNCRHRCFRVFPELGENPQLACTKAYADQRHPELCDQVHPMGICTHHERDESA